uniref:Ovule protein n=1 Tax=Bursaphelenchus xylophilus TaxID=6326 RepID=A0A1I7S0V6_BURXY
MKQSSATHFLNFPIKTSSAGKKDVDLDDEAVSNFRPHLSTRLIPPSLRGPKTYWPFCFQSSPDVRRRSPLESRPW